MFKKLADTLKEEVFSREEVRDIRTSLSGSSNGKPMKSIALWVGTREMKLSSWVEEEAADSFAEEVRKVLF